MVVSLTNTTLLCLCFLQLQSKWGAWPVLHQPRDGTDYHQLPAGPRGEGQLPAAGGCNRWRAARGLVQLCDRVRDSGRHQRQPSALPSSSLCDPYPCLHCNRLVRGHKMSQFAPGAYVCCLFTQLHLKKTTSVPLKK